MEKSSSPVSLTAIILPACLLIGLATTLFLTVHSASLATLRAENERELSRHAELAGSLKAIREQLEPAKRDLAAAATEQSRLAEEKKTATEVIARAAGIGQSLEQLRKDEAAAQRRLEEIRRTQNEASDKLDSSRATLASLEAKVRQISSDRSESEARLAETSAKEASLLQKVADRERILANREKSLAEKDRLIAERDAELAALNATVKRFETQKRQIESEILEKKTEAKSLSDQLAGLDRERVSANELQRLRSEKIDLAARIESMRQELRTAEAAFRERESSRQELERSIIELNARKNSADSGAKKP